MANNEDLSLSKSVLYEISIGTSNVSVLNDNQQHDCSTADSPFERQLSMLDPLSARVSTILVWKNLTVLTREDRAKEFFQKLKLWKKFTPKRQCLLNNISGAITGGLWAVMGLCILKISIYIYLRLNFRSIGFR
jgi:hypothetical protein